MVFLKYFIKNFILEFITAFIKNRKTHEKWVKYFNNSCFQIYEHLEYIVGNVDFIYYDHLKNNAHDVDN